MMNELYHYGIKDMKWGVRRFQDYAGKLTEAGRERYGVGGKRVKSALNTAKNMAKYSNAAFAYRGAKRRAQHEFQYGVSPKLKKASRIAKSRFGEVSSKARDVSDRVSDASKSASRRFSRAVTDATIQGRILGRELSYLSATTMNKVNRVLNANTREAARLRSYVDSDRFARAKKAQLANLNNQSEYKVRKAAGEAFVRGLSGLRQNVALASEQRVTDRTSGAYGAGLDKMTGPHYRFLKTKGRSVLARRAPALKIADDYNRSVDDWMRRIEEQRKFTSESFNRARGR